MKYIMEKSNIAKYGYDYVIIDDNDNEIERKHMNSKTSDGYFHQIIDDLNIKYIKISEIDDNLDENGRYELTERAPRITSNSTSKKWESFMTDEERTQYDAIKAKCEERLKESRRPKTPLEKAQAELEKWMKKVEMYQAQAQAQNR